MCKPQKCNINRLAQKVYDGGKKNTLFIKEAEIMFRKFVEISTLFLNAKADVFDVHKMPSAVVLKLID